MNPGINLLITLTDGQFLIKVAIQLPEGSLTEDCLKYPLEPENKKKIKDKMPPHVQIAGDIVEVEGIFEIKTYKS